MVTLIVVSTTFARNLIVCIFKIITCSTKIAKALIPSMLEWRVLLTVLQCRVVSEETFTCGNKIYAIGIDFVVIKVIISTLGKGDCTEQELLNQLSQIQPVAVMYGLVMS